LVWGFTLSEVLIATVIVGVLASLAIPQFTRTIERAYWRDARDLLMTTYAGEQVYFAANDAYYAPGTWNTIYMDNPNGGSVPVSFTVGVVGKTFTATATRNGGLCNGKVQTINELRQPGAGDNWPASGDC